MKDRIDELKDDYEYVADDDNDFDDNDFDEEDRVLLDQLYHKIHSNHDALMKRFEIAKKELQTELDKRRLNNEISRNSKR